MLDDRGCAYVGCAGPVADLCMDKHRTKLALVNEGLPTPSFELVVPGDAVRLKPPVVLKPPREGSSIDIRVCHDARVLEAALAELAPRHPRLLVEKWIEGPELTVGLVGRGDDRTPEPLPVIRIEPAAGFYDYEAKYERDDTVFRFDTGLDGSLVRRIEQLAVDVYEGLGCRHLARVDVMVDAVRGEPSVLEVNTIPGFTSHSLLPMAARRAGMELPALVDRLVRLPLGRQA